MVFKPIPNLESGITLIEIIVVIFIIGVFSSILVADFPKIQANYNLSRAAYKMAQNIRKAEDLGLSGAQMKYADGSNVPAKGYGIYVDLQNPLEPKDAVPWKKYHLYADICGPDSSNNNVADNEFTNITNICKDYVLEAVNLQKDDPGVVISEIKNGLLGAGKEWISINFSPPNPDIYIANLDYSKYNKIGIVLSLEDNPDAQKTVWVNTSGLIEVE